MSQEQDRGILPSTDPDLAEKAKPGHGLPAEDPDPAAQYPIEPEQAEEERKTVYMGGGVMAGAAAGAAVGTAVAGPVGTFVGTLGGAVVGALGAAAVGAATEPGDTPAAVDAETGPGDAPAVVPEAAPADDGDTPERHSTTRPPAARP